MYFMFVVRCEQCKEYHTAYLWCLLSIKNILVLVFLLKIHLGSLSTPKGLLHTFIRSDVSDWELSY